MKNDTSYSTFMQYVIVQSLRLSYLIFALTMISSMIFLLVVRHAEPDRISLAAFLVASFIITWGNRRAVTQIGLMAEAYRDPRLSGMRGTVATLVCVDMISLAVAVATAVRIISALLTNPQI